MGTDCCAIVHVENLLTISGHVFVSRDTSLDAPLCYSTLCESSSNVICEPTAESTVAQSTSCCSHKDAKLSVTMNQTFSGETVVEFHIILHCHFVHRNCVDEEAR